MPHDTDTYDFLVSCARKDNESGWVTQSIEALLAEHKRFAAGRELLSISGTSRDSTRKDREEDGI